MSSPSAVLFASVLFVAPSISVADEWYVHRTDHVMNVPPWYCYCYRVTKTNVIPGIVAYELEVQLSREDALTKLTTYAAQPQTCPGNCVGGGASGVHGEYTPYLNLSGRWQSTNGAGESLDFVATADGRKFSATSQGIVLTMTTASGGRVELEMVINKRSVKFGADIPVQNGRPVEMLVFSPMDSARAERFHSFTMRRVN